MNVRRKTKAMWEVGSHGKGLDSYRQAVRKKELGWGLNGITGKSPVV